MFTYLDEKTLALRDEFNATLDDRDVERRVATNRRLNRIRKQIENEFRIGLSQVAKSSVAFLESIGCWVMFVATCKDPDEVGAAVLVNSMFPDMEYLRAIPRLIRFETDGQCQFADTELRLLSSIRSLRIIFLKKTYVTDTGLAALVNLDRLHWLDLSGTKITDEAIPVLGQLISLRRLGVADTLLTSEGLNRLKTELPKCYIRDVR